MIKSNYSIKVLKLIFNKIVKQIHKHFYNSKKLLKGSMIMISDVSGLSQRNATNENDSNIKKNSYELTNPQVLLNNIN